MSVKRLNTEHADFDEVLNAWLARRHDPTADASVQKRVETILADVRQGGNDALMRWTEELDGWTVEAASELELSPEKMQQIGGSVDPQIRQDLALAAERIRRFHELQIEQSWTLQSDYGITLSQRCSPLKSVGVYVPGGTAAYPSTVLMNVVAARTAGVAEIIMVTPAPSGELSPAVVAAAELAGVDRVFLVGGAQAIAALAFGSTIVPRVDKIVGPGNQWVAAAKRQVYGVVDIDMIAGPSELCVVATCDGGATANQLAADLLSQAEHDPQAMVSFLSPDADFIERVLEAVDALLVSLPRRQIAEASLENWGLAILTKDIKQALTLANRIAPEHLELVLPNAELLSESIDCAGAIFCGPHTPEAVGDYLAGPNHVLPTGGTARFFSPLGVYDFVKRTNVIRFTKEGLNALGPATMRLATVEGLDAHARSIKERLDP
jgi:histidinol dehydrogenase